MSNWVLAMVKGVQCWEGQGEFAGQILGLGCEDFCSCVHWAEANQSLHALPSLSLDSLECSFFG